MKQIFNYEVTVMNQVGLVLEGGGMRALYSAGVMEYFLKQKLFFPYVIGVSAGASNAVSYLSRQEGRNKVVNIDYADDPRYFGLNNLITGQGLFGMDFIFDEIPNQLELFDFKSFFEHDGKFVVGTTDCETGEPIYFTKEDCQTEQDILTIIRASCSLPFIAPTVEFRERILMDGGISDPIPIEKSINDGNEKNVVILTRNKGYRKSSSKLKWLAKLFYSRYPGLVEALFNRHKLYNQTVKYIEELEEEGKVFVFRPPTPLEVGRMETDKEKLTNLYYQGIKDAKRNYQELQEWLT
jgi:predicted patatin/cPLA2 family phospholipase